MELRRAPFGPGAASHTQPCQVTALALRQDEPSTSLKRLRSSQ